MKYSLSISQDLRRSTYSGRYYAFEGIDGSGKSTQVEKIKTYLQNLSQTVVITSEPMAEGPIQKVIRDTLFSKIKIPSRAYQNLYSADRVLNHESIVQPALSLGNIVLTHRSFWSNVPYGLIDLGDEYDFSKESSIIVSQGMLSNFYQFLVPDKTFYLKVSVDHAIERLQHMDKTKDIYENKQKLAKIITGYERVISEFPDEFVIIDGEQEEEKVTQEITAAISK